MEEQLQRQRFERKYLVSEDRAKQIREFVKYHLVPDEYSEGRPEYSYPVHSLYLDSDSLLTYWATVHCEKKRFKLRVRFYDDNPEAPLFFEIKRRENECVLKQRGIVHRRSGATLLAGHLPGPEHIASRKPHHFVALQRFSHLTHKLDARPMVHVAYMREAWVSQRNNSVRVTLDRNVRGEPRLQALFSTQMVNPIHVFGPQVVLELKFTDRFPGWFNQLVRHFDLLQTGAPKYCGSLALAGEARVVNTKLENHQERLAWLADYC
ncbi:MAG TPA: polyphosphate polymerase domain-containing protein [Verrucomicrobiae bacterium]|nr:polyphosphate polymerase domain-containing protein [Verrucomicrobiae bacterium]